MLHEDAATDPTIGINCTIFRGFVMHAESNVFRRTAREAARASVFAIALASLMPATAAAQSVAPANGAQIEPDAPDETVANEIVVTGTRVIRDGYEAPTPLTVVSQEEIQNQSPTNNIADFVNQLPSVAGSTRPANSRLSLSSGAAGLNTINLRNLGSTRTLVLLDGRRSVGSSVTNLVDVNTFPQALISSVQVVTGGASAAYGSDAVAGVVNFVLNKQYKGLKLSADSGITDEGDGQNYSFDIAGGTSFAGDRGHVLLSAEYAHRDGIFQVDRDWNQIGYRTIQNPDYTATNGQPRNLVRFGTGTSNVLPGSIINASTVFAGSGVAANSLRGIYFGQGGSVNQFQYGTINSTTLTTGGDWRLADTSRNIGLDAEEDRYGAFGRVSFELAPWIEVFAQGSYNWQKTLFNAGPQLTTGGSAGTLRGDNAYLVNTLGAQRLVGINTVTIGTTAVDLPYRKTNNQRDTQRYLIGAEGQFDLFGKNAVWDIYGQYGETNTREQLRDIMQPALMALAVDAVFAPAGNALGVPAGAIVCRSLLTAPSNGCVPLNRLGIGVTSQASIDYVLGDPYRDQKLTQKVAGVNLSFTPFATWAGDVSLAVGGEYREEKVSGFVPTEFQTGWAVGNYLPTFGSYNVKEAYLETVVPLGLGLEFNGAVRATDYSTSGYVTTWKVGATWQPIDDIRLRATQSRDIRAPNLSELFQAGTSRTDTVSDPFRSNPITGESPLPGITFRETTTGNINLRPERADSTSIGVILQPRFLPGFSFSADGYQIKVKDAIDQFFAQQIINRCFEGRQEFCAAFTRNAPGTSDRELSFRSSPFNFAKVTVRGIDFDASYRLPIDGLIGAGSKLTLRALATHYIDRIVDTGVADVVPVDSVGSNGGDGPPTWIFRASATIDTPRFSVTGVGRGVSTGTNSNSFIECQTTCPTSTTQFPTVDNNRVSGLFYFDLNLTTKIDVRGAGDGQIFLNVTNLFDADPLLLPEGGLSANTTYSDLLGRAFRVGFRIALR